MTIDRRITWAARGWAVLTATLCVACSPNHRPQIQPIPDTTFFVGARKRLHIRAYDADADRLRYDFSAPAGLREQEIRDRAEILAFIDTAIFSWEPIAADVGQHRFDFSASDGLDADIESANFTVKPGTDPTGEAPRFLRPLNVGETLDLNQKDCIRVKVVVEDDSADVQIFQQVPIPGARLETQGPLAAEFSWCPSRAQQLQRKWILQLAADDGDNPPVGFNNGEGFTIVLVPPGERPDGETRGKGDNPQRTVLWENDFETDNGGLSATGDWQWGTLAFSGGASCSAKATPPPNAHSGTNAWGTRINGCYTGIGNSETPCNSTSPEAASRLEKEIEIPPGYKKVTLVFFEWTDLYLPHDWAELRVNGKPLDQRCKGSYIKPAGWTQHRVDLSHVIGQRVRLGFHFMASAVVNYAGWYIDDVTVVAE